jgi:Na+/proline symporter
LLSLYSKKINKYGAWTGILLGGSIAAVWPYVNEFIEMKIPSMVPAFTISFLSILIVSALTQHKLKVEIGPSRD